jgi:hypothetical protein
MMPVWDVKCKKCGNEMEIFRRIASMDDLPLCCDEPMQRQVCMPFVPQEFQPYRSMIDGRMITDRGEHRRHLKANGCIEVGNEKLTPKKPEKSKKDQENLRQDLSQRLEAARV